jgi:hypothetical protein
VRQCEDCLLFTSGTDLGCWEEYGQRHYQCRWCKNHPVEESRQLRQEDREEREREIKSGK